MSHRRGRPLVYLGGSDAIEDILGIMGATREVFDFINAKIKREIRNNVNRANKLRRGEYQEDGLCLGGADRRDRAAARRRVSPQRRTSSDVRRS